MTTITPAEVRADLQAKYEGALDFIENLTVQPMNPKLVAADYALNGSFMRSYDLDESTFRDALNNVADAIRDAAS